MYSQGRKCTQDRMCGAGFVAGLIQVSCHEQFTLGVTTLSAEIAERRGKGYLLSQSSRLRGAAICCCRMLPYPLLSLTGR